MTDDPGSLLPVALQATAAASAIMRTSPPRAGGAEAGGDWASEVELAVVCAIRSRLTAETPGIGFLGQAEERTRMPAAEWAWALGPVDLRSDFARSVPLCVVSLALLHHGHPVLGVIDAPFLKKCYHAVEGQGAYLGDRRLAASTVADLRNAVVAIGDCAAGQDPGQRNQARLAASAQLAPRVHRIRMLGTTVLDLAWVAEGQRDASVTLGHKPWGIAPGVIIAREAGATVVEIVADGGSSHAFGSAATLAGPVPLIAQLGPLVQAIGTDQHALNGA